MYGFESGQPDFSNRHDKHSQQVEPLLSLYQDGEASPEERRTVEYYLARCAECRALLDSFQQVETALQSYLKGVAAPRLDMSLFRSVEFFLDAAANSPASVGQTTVVPRGNLTVVPPVVGGGYFAARRPGFASRFGGTLAACALLMGVGLLLVLSIQGLNKPPVFTTDVAVAPSTTFATSRVEASPISQDTATTIAPTTQTTNITQPTTQTNPAPTSPRPSVVTPLINGVATTATVSIGPATTILPTLGATTNPPKTLVNTTPPTNTTVAPANSTLAPRSTTSAPTFSQTSPPVATSPAITTVSAPSVVTNPAVTTATSAPTETTTVGGSATATTTAPTTAIVSPTITDVPANATTTVTATSIPTSVVASSAVDTTKSSLVTPVVVTTTASSAPAITTLVSGTTTLAAPTTAIDTPKTTTVAATTKAPVNLVSPPVHAPGLLAYVSSKDGEIHLVASDGSNDHLFTRGTAQIMWQQLVWSPDARWLAAVGRAGSLDSIYLLDTNSSSPDLNPVIEGIQPVWSLDSRMLAYLSNISVESGVRIGKSRVIDLKHHTVTHLNNVATGFAPQWFPDGQRLLVGQEDIYRISQTSKTSDYDVTLVQHLQLSYQNTCVGNSLSPDGTRLAALELDKNGGITPVIYNLSGGDLARKALPALTGLGNGLKAGRSCGDNRLNWTPTGRSIYFYAQNSGNNYYNVLVAVATGEASYLAGVYAPSFSADGAYLTDFEPATRQAYSISSNLAGRPTNPFAVAQGVVVGPVWQPYYK